MEQKLLQSPSSDQSELSAAQKLLTAVKSGNEAFVKELIQQYHTGENRYDSPLFCQDNHGWTPLMWAASKGHAKIVEMCLQHRLAPVNHTSMRWKGASPKGTTALHECAATMPDGPPRVPEDNNFLAAAQRLLDSGADPFIENTTGVTAIDTAIKGGNIRLKNLMESVAPFKGILWLSINGKLFSGPSREARHCVAQPRCVYREESVEGGTMERVPLYLMIYKNEQVCHPSSSIPLADASVTLLADPQAPFGPEKGYLVISEQHAPVKGIVAKDNKIEIHAPLDTAHQRGSQVLRQLADLVNVTKGYLRPIELEPEASQERPWFTGIMAAEHAPQGKGLARMLRANTCIGPIPCVDDFHPRPTLNRPRASSMDSSDIVSPGTSATSRRSSAAFVVASSIKAAARKPQSEITPETPPQVQPAQLRVRTRQQARSSQDSEMQPDGPPQGLAEATTWKLEGPEGSEIEGSLTALPRNQSLPDWQRERPSQPNKIPSPLQSRHPTPYKPRPKSNATHRAGSPRVITDSTASSSSSQYKSAAEASEASLSSNGKHRRHRSKQAYGHVSLQREGINLAKLASQGDASDSPPWPEERQEGKLPDMRMNNAFEGSKTPMLDSLLETLEMAEQADGHNYDPTITRKPSDIRRIQESLHKAMEHAEPAHQPASPPARQGSANTQLSNTWNNPMYSVEDEAKGSRMRPVTVSKAPTTTSKDSGEYTDMGGESQAQKWDKPSGGAAITANSQLKKMLQCPITKELMRDPVLLLEDGITYERSAIEKRLKDTSISPSTGEPVLDQRLIPNVALRKSIEAFHAHPGGPRGRRQGRSQQPEPAELP